jgi:hypothetical protein
MAALTVQSLQGLATPGAGSAAAAGGDVLPMGRRARVKVVVGGTATTVTLTPTGPYIKGAPARVFTSVSNTTIDEPTWNYPGHPGSPDLGLLAITYSQVTGVTTGGYVVEGR